MRDGVMQTIDDGAPLPSDTLALQLSSVRRGLRRLHDPDLLPLRSHDRRIAQALLLVDLVHGLHHLGVRHQLCDQGLVDLEAVVAHLDRESLLHRVGDVILLLEGLVQGKVRYTRPHHIRDVGVDLRMDVRELVDGVHRILRLHGLLHGDFGRDEDVVLRLRVHLHHQLVHSAGDGTVLDATTAAIKAREGQAGFQHVTVLPEVFHGIVLVLWHRHEAICARQASALLFLRHGTKLLELCACDCSCSKKTTCKLAERRKSARAEP
mmetsp:Transcript_55000/g.178777  ORF Transcript_55000/g.178777 Transcript_55000/m.178777 type:complete len:265 (+) Transcript_55000:443-1237(+)